VNEQTKIYLVRAGRIGEDEENALEEGLAIIGFLEYPSLQGMRDYASVAKLVHDTTPGSKPRANGNRAGQLWAFAVSMKEGDVVVLPRKLTSQVALGRVTGPYQYRKIGNEFRHTRPVEWIRPDVPRNTFAQDLLGSFGAFMTVCNIARNGAEQRIMAVLEGQADPGFSGDSAVIEVPAAPLGTEPASATDFAELSNDQIVAHIQSRFHGHALAGLVDAVLRADGWVTKLSPPGPDGGVDILAGRGSLGLDSPRLCVQVKSQATPCDVTVFRTLQGSMQSFKAEQGLLVCWGGFNRPVQSEARQGHFSVRLWDSGDLVEAIYRNYDRLPAEIQAELPLKKVWMLVLEKPAE
jgi:restriction system protein